MNVCSGRGALRNREPRFTYRRHLQILLPSFRGRFEACWADIVEARATKEEFNYQDHSATLDNIYGGGICHNLFNPIAAQTWCIPSPGDAITLFNTAGSQDLFDRSAALQDILTPPNSDCHPSKFRTHLNLLKNPTHHGSGMRALIEHQSNADRRNT